ncbi:hypothetical protein Q0F98_23500 [Paenibacillus amylolyticus]|nr:hypothetical protein Q0F98_23500 [Paenibacillus amylolyticus]
MENLQEQAKQEPLEIGRCYPVGRTLNLVTKAKFSNKPTYQSLTNAVESMRDVCVMDGITETGYAPNRMWAGQAEMGEGQSDYTGSFCRYGC